MVYTVDDVAYVVEIRHYLTQLDITFGIVKLAEYHMHRRSNLFNMCERMLGVALCRNGGVGIFYVSMNVWILFDIAVCYGTAH